MRDTHENTNTDTRRSHPADTLPPHLPYHTNHAATPHAPRPTQRASPRRVTAPPSRDRTAAGLPHRRPLAACYAASAVSCPAGVASAACRTADRVRCLRSAVLPLTVLPCLGRRLLPLNAACCPPIICRVRPTGAVCCLPCSRTSSLSSAPVTPVKAERETCSAVVAAVLPLLCRVVTARRVIFEHSRSIHSNSSSVGRPLERRQSFKEALSDVRGEGSGGYVDGAAP